MEIVVNEWLLEYMRPNIASEKTSLAIRFLKALAEKGDKIVVRRPSPFFKKFRRYMKESGQYIHSKQRFKHLNNLFHNSDNTRIVDDSDVKNLPPEIETLVPPDDKYLIETTFSSPNKTFITTDTRLKEKLQSVKEIRIFLLEEFMQDYTSVH